MSSGRVTWDDQRAFLAVLDEGSLSAAARRLGVAQPTVRARIEALEQAVGAVLFTRSVNGLVPTDQARGLADSARAMARASDAFVRAASAPPGEIAGAVRLSVSEFVGVEVLPPMLASLRAAHPRVIVEVSLSNAAADLLEQEVDIAVRMHAPRHEALVARKVGAIPLGLFAHPDYLDRRGVPTDMDDLLAHDFIGPDRVRVDLELAAMLHPGLTRDRFVVRTDNHPAVLAYARAGLGLAVVQRPIGAADPQLRAVLPELVVGRLDTWIVTHGDLRQVPRVRAVFDHLAEAFTRYAREA
ncbi:MAG: LysR family transcriptional regulator [Alphaproteobacteria bacterium]|nr:LysR family transcriptional regulator [Alphaproteobacteria bacterium]MBU1516774.1 LysR family transcriptional regulator [Alphaproteobacteria bacterium]MBU2092468.1 LysR family transcriptional regulator [Alphaproteobacteria bacterium]MBU2152401.1 LysR family transcriptional regulator [Alphaproteobacteria bacterium]MBU2305612.1 LysR family transcriptional regulator [Alphaproteobacteria bacterium]